MSDSSPSSRDAHASGSHFQPSTSVVFIIVVLFVAATFLMVRAASPSTNSGTTIPTTTSGSSTTTTAATHPAIKKSQVRVQVANGTLTQGLAGRITQTLQIQGWDTLPAGNGPHVTATIVYYNPPFKSDALEIATTIHVPASAVVPLGGANPIAGSSTDDVIVVLGPNSAIG